MLRRLRNARNGLTLIELVVVLAILAVLAAMLLPKFEGLQNSANHAAAAGSASDAARLIGAYKAAKTVYPNGWDSLTDGTNLWAAGDVGLQTKGLHRELSGGTDAKLTFTNLSSDEVEGLKRAGITTVYNVNTSSTLRPGDMFTTPATITTSTPLAIVSAAGEGKDIIDHIYRANLQTGTTPGVSGTIPPGVKLVVFGLGPQNGLIPNSMLEAPTYGNANAQFIYNRLLVVFELNGKSATFKAVLGTDGDLLDDLSVHLQKAKM